MADQKISQLNELTSPLSGDTLPIVNGGETKKITVSNLLSGSNIQPYFISTDTGSVQNFKVGDNVWLGDIGEANTLVVNGIQDSGSAFVMFGYGTDHIHPYIGHIASENANVLSVVADTTKISNAVIIGSGSLVAGDPEMLHIYSSGSFNIAYLKGNTDNYTQINVQNTNSSAGASSDIVATADNGTEEIHYVNMGINSSGFLNEFSIGYQNDAYLYNAGRDLYIGTMDAPDINHGHVHLFTSNSWQNPQISILNNQKVGFNTDIVTEGYTYEFSGSVKINNLISLSPVTELPTGSTLGDIVVSGSNLYFHNGMTWGKIMTEPTSNIFVNNINGPIVGNFSATGVTFNESFPLSSGSTVTGLGTIQVGDNLQMQITGTENYLVEYYVNEIIQSDYTTSGTGPGTTNATSNFAVTSSDQLEIKITTF
jgi:hypothetical protein